MSDHDWLHDPAWPRVVTEADWRPGLPPPIEALCEKFPPDAGWEIEYATHVERDDAAAAGWRTIPVAIAKLPGRQTFMFFPERPKLLMKHTREASHARDHNTGEADLSR
jgi:hypothetical protein